MTQRREPSERGDRAERARRQSRASEATEPSERGGQLYRVTRTSPIGFSITAIIWTSLTA